MNNRNFACLISYIQYDSINIGAEILDVYASWDEVYVFVCKVKTSINNIQKA